MDEVCEYKVPNKRDDFQMATDLKDLNFQLLQKRQSRKYAYFRHGHWKTVILFCKKNDSKHKGIQYHRN